RTAPAKRMPKSSPPSSTKAAQSRPSRCSSNEPPRMKSRTAPSPRRRRNRLMAASSSPSPPPKPAKPGPGPPRHPMKERPRLRPSDAESRKDPGHQPDARREGNGSDENGEEEEVVESVGGDDALEEATERLPRIRRQYKIQEVIKRRQIMLVQVVKEER